MHSATALYRAGEIEIQARGVPIVPVHSATALCSTGEIFLGATGTLFPSPITQHYMYLINMCLQFLFCAQGGRTRDDRSSDAGRQDSGGRVDGSDRRQVHGPFHFEQDRVHEGMYVCMYVLRRHAGVRVHGYFLRLLC